MQRYFNKKILNKQKTVLFYTIIWVVTITYGIYVLLTNTHTIKDYKVSECFTLETTVHPVPTEHWHPPELTKKIEYIVLKVGKKNYYTSNELGTLQDISFNFTKATEKSDCSRIFNKEKILNN